MLSILHLWRIDRSIALGTRQEAGNYREHIDEREDVSFLLAHCVCFISRSTSATRWFNSALIATFTVSPGVKPTLPT